jgi:hypothetical protein
MSLTINRSHTNNLEVAARKESITKARKHLINNIVVANSVRDSINKSPNSDAVTNALAKVYLGAC